MAVGLTVGLIGEAEMVVTDRDTAVALGSGTVPVLGTPALACLMERAAVQSLEGYLPEGYTSVGSRLDLRHLAPTPVGVSVRARAELTEVVSRRLLFSIQAWDEVEKVGEGVHERVIVERARFVSAAERKAHQLQEQHDGRRDTAGQG
ncbi:MAG: thioesterase family protein [Anaerolineae bacterium]|nr:thioesterase family protein [Anaerolineae bacterium]